MEFIISIVSLVASLLAVLGVVWGLGYRWGQLQTTVDNLKTSINDLKDSVEKYDLPVLKRLVDELWEIYGLRAVSNNPYVRRASAYHPTAEGLDRLPQEIKSHIERRVREGVIKELSDLPIALDEIGGAKRLYEIGEKIGIPGEQLYGIVWSYTAQLIEEREKD